MRRGTRLFPPMLRPSMLACLLACAEWRMAPTFPVEAAGRPVVQEQAVMGLSDGGDAAVAQLVDADGRPAELDLLLFDRTGAPSRTALVASAEVAARVARRILEGGHALVPVLAAAVAQEWPEALAHLRQAGYAPRQPAQPEPGTRRWLVEGAAAAGALPLALRLAPVDDGLALLLGERGPGLEVELARMSLAGPPIAPELWIQSGVVWLLAGSVGGGDPLHRAAGMRRATLGRGEAQLHDQHGLEEYAAGDIDAARREFARSIACDPAFVDGLYNAAAAAAIADRAEEAVALLRRGAAVDPARVQVLGRNDEDLKTLRKRADVRALLGLHRLPPEDLGR